MRSGAHPPTNSGSEGEYLNFSSSNLFLYDMPSIIDRAFADGKRVFGERGSVSLPAYNQWLMAPAQKALRAPPAGSEVIRNSCQC